MLVYHREIERRCTEVQALWRAYDLETSQRASLPRFVVVGLP